MRRATLRLFVSPLRRSQLSLRGTGLRLGSRSSSGRFFHWLSQVTSGKASFTVWTGILPCQTGAAELILGPSQQPLWVAWVPFSHVLGLAPHQTERHRVGQPRVVFRVPLWPGSPFLPHLRMIGPESNTPTPPPVPFYPSSPIHSPDTLSQPWFPHPQKGRQSCLPGLQGAGRGGNLRASAI